MNTKAAQQKPAPVTTTVEVTADRGLADSADSSTSVSTLSAAALATAPGLTLDDSLRQAAGFQLFRRTSSWTANPTTEGVSLRGLGSTAASRTLVVSDQVPLNDPFGGWIHWDELPALLVARADLLRGGSADLYGSAAIGGVIDLVPVTPALETTGPPTILHAAATVLGATEDSAHGDGLVTLATERLAALAALSGFATGGYIATAPAFRGDVDVPSGSEGVSARTEVHARPARWPDDAFLRGNLLDEARGNGTPLQTNGTRLWRYAAGADAARAAGSANARVFGSRETYRQSFSAIAADRDSEALTRLQRVPLDELGFALLASHPFGRRVDAVLGADLRDIRASDDETSVARGSTTSTSAHQRDVGGFADLLVAPSRWLVNASLRADRFRTFAAQQTASAAAATTALPELDELAISPHLGLLRRLGTHAALNANAFRAFRGPTLNELYRTGQVGSQTTLANSQLLAERATGFEFGSGWESHNMYRTAVPLHVHADYFWTEINRPVSAVLLSETPDTQTLQRQNLGQIRSRGVELEADATLPHGVAVSIGYQFAVATVTAFNSSSPAQANLTGNWIPQVPRHSIIVSASGSVQHTTLRAIISYTGLQFDDAANQFPLHPFARFDVYAERPLADGFAVFAAAQNLLDRAIDAGRTPVLTLAAPRLVEAGLRWRR